MQGRELMGLQVAARATGKSVARTCEGAVGRGPNRELAGMQARFANPRDLRSWLLCQPAVPTYEKTLASGVAKATARAGHACANGSTCELFRDLQTGQLDLPRSG